MSSPTSLPSHLRGFDSRTSLEIRIDDLTSDLGKFKRMLLKRSLDSNEFDRTIRAIQDIVTDIEMEALQEKMQNRRFMRRAVAKESPSQSSRPRHPAMLKRSPTVAHIETPQKRQLTPSSPLGKKGLVSPPTAPTQSRAPALMSPQLRKTFQRPKLQSMASFANLPLAKKRQAQAITKMSMRQRKKISKESLKKSDFHDQESVKDAVEQFFNEEQQYLYSRMTFGGGSHAMGPKGTVCIVISRIVSKSIWFVNYDVMKESVILHNKLIREELKRCDGFEVSCFLDRHVFAFSTASQGVEFCLRVQYRLTLLKWPVNLLRYKEAKEERDQTGKIIFRGLRVSMAVHIGKTGSSQQPKDRRETYKGSVKDYCEKLNEKSRQGEIAISEKVYRRIREKLHTFTYKPKIVAREIGNSDNYLLVVYPEEMFYRGMYTSSNFWYLEEEDSTEEMSEKEFLQKVEGLFRLSTRFSRMKSIEKLEKMPKMKEELEKLFTKEKMDLMAFLKQGLKKETQADTKDFLEDLYSVKKSVKQQIKEKKKKRKKKKKQLKKKIRKIKSQTLAARREKKRREKFRDMGTMTVESGKMRRFDVVDVGTNCNTLAKKRDIFKKLMRPDEERKQNAEVQTDSGGLVSIQKYELLEKKIAQMKKKKKDLKRIFREYKKETQKKLEEYKHMNEVQIRLLAPMLSSDEMPGVVKGK